ncbi:MAG: hypothetical protein BGN87_06445 [Rhizobiales bacterium 65-79]|jgi:hypothetical protein|nr:hypothetical protein [Hyphomicrobiales bacterium]OJU02829.1 MAG: hypothetical protein BGN87_06445 [Rhizobiales bacterium 65-79]
MSNEVKFRLRGNLARRGQDHAWATIRKLGANGGLFTVDDVHGLSNDPRRSSVAEFMWRLEKAGFIVRAGTVAGAEPGRRRRQFRLAKPQKATPNVDRDGGNRPRLSARQSMWNVMRGPAGRRGFTVDDLVLCGSTDEAPVTRAGAQSYVNLLARAGYLLRLGSRRSASFRLKPSMNTGPMMPRVLASKDVYDQNLDRVFDRAGASS